MSKGKDAFELGDLQMCREKLRKELKDGSLRPIGRHDVNNLSDMILRVERTTGVKVVCAICLCDMFIKN